MQVLTNYISLLQVDAGQFSNKEVLCIIHTVEHNYMESRSRELQLSMWNQ